MKSSFISTVSHEFRTPLATILSSFELMKAYGENWDTKKHNKHYNRVMKSIDQLTGMIDDVLILNKVDTGRLGFNPEIVNLRHLLKTIIEEEELHLGKNHTFKTDVVLIEDEQNIDEKLMRMTITNLLSNAIKYSPDGGLVDFIFHESDDEFQVMIKDQGLGISKKDQKMIFNAFYRSDEVSEIPGSGLGLSIVDRAIQLQGGKIKYKSEIGVGTEFFLKIPKVRDRVNEN